MRLNQFIAHSGLCSRRKADEYIDTGRISINGKVVLEMGYKVDLEKDEVFFDTEKLQLEESTIYLLLRKPRSYVTTLNDEFDRPTIMDLINVKERVYPVGRLDYDSRGLILLTNDGDLAFKLSHPSFEAEKVYQVFVSRPLKFEEIKIMEAGVRIDGKRTSPCKIKSLFISDKGQKLEFVLHEGRNRQIRKMLETIDVRVKDLERINYAGLNNKGLEEGQYRFLSDEEIETLKKVTQHVKSRNNSRN